MATGLLSAISLPETCTPPLHLECFCVGVRVSSGSTFTSLNVTDAWDLAVRSIVFPGSLVKE